MFRQLLHLALAMNPMQKREANSRQVSRTFNMNSLATFQKNSSVTLEALSRNYGNFSSNTAFKFFKTVRTIFYFYSVNSFNINGVRINLT